MPAGDKQINNWVSEWLAAWHGWQSVQFEGWKPTRRTLNNLTDVHKLLLMSLLLLLLLLFCCCLCHNLTSFSVVSNKFAKNYKTSLCFLLLLRLLLWIFMPFSPFNFIIIFIDLGWAAVNWFHFAKTEKQSIIISIVLSQLYMCARVWLSDATDIEIRRNVRMCGSHFFLFEVETINIIYAFIVLQEINDQIFTIFTTSTKV